MIKKNGRLRLWRNGFFLAVVMAILLFVLSLVFSMALQWDPFLVFGVDAGAFLLFIGVYILLSFRLSASDPTVVDRGLGEQIADAFRGIDAPCAYFSCEGRLSFANEAFFYALRRNDVAVGARLEKLLPSTYRELSLLPQGERKTLSIDDRLYAVSVSRTTDKFSGGIFVAMNDVTEFTRVKKLLHEERTVVAYILIDNIEEVMQFVQERFNKCASAVEDCLKEWVVSMGGVLRSYERDRFVVMFDVEHLETEIANRFSVLDKVREVRVGDGISVTISMGVANVRGSLADREEAALSALDLALQRGGDQVVYRSENDTQFFGGKTKALYKRANVRSRVVAAEIASLVGRADNVLIMGHRFGDYDSFGASVGMARLCMVFGAKVNIVVSFSDTNIRECIQRMQENEEYKNVFIDGSEGMDRIRPDTLAIVVDVNNLDNVEYPSIVRNVKNLVIIDHHRKTADFTVNPRVTYIEPFASSASELVAEVLEQSISAKTLLRDEAEMLLSGILLDTKQFTRNTGTRTFGAALYLRGEGANPTETNELFKSEVSEVVKEAKFHSNVHIYRDTLAITVCEDDGDPSYRVVAAKAADKLLLVRNVEASFTLVRIDNKVHISARSAGRVNVQLILEKLHGGGHFDVAGAQVGGKTTFEVVEMLKNAIDDYFENDADKLDENEDVAEG